MYHKNVNGSLINFFNRQFFLDEFFTVNSPCLPNSRGPTAETEQLVRVVENTNWVFLALINLDMLRKIYRNVKGSPIAKGFLAFMAVFFFIFLWKGSALYVQVYGLDHLAGQFPFRYQFSLLIGHLGNILASLSVGATFLYLARLLR